MNNWERVLVVGVLVALAFLIARVEGINPWSAQPFLLDSTSTLSGEMSINLLNEKSMTFETTVENQNGIPNTIRTPVANYATRELAIAAHAAAINLWLADTTAGGS